MDTEIENTEARETTTKPLLLGNSYTKVTNADNQ